MVRAPYLYCVLECAIACMLPELLTDAAAALLGHALGILQGITNRLRRIKPLHLLTLQHASPVKGP